MERSGLYGFLAEVYRLPPTPDLLRRLRQPGLQAALAGAGVALGPDFLDRGEEELVEDLAVEFTRLFVGPGPHVPPNAAVHTEGEGGALWGESTGRVKRFIEDTGFTYRPGHGELPDHISVELEFVGELAAREAQALEEGDRDAADRLRQTQRAFVTGHMADWIPDFCDQVMAKARLPFYRELAGLTKGFIRSEAAALAGPPDAGGA